jgi:hypothetical protein
MAHPASKIDGLKWPFYRCVRSRRSGGFLVSQAKPLSQVLSADRVFVMRAG